MSTDNRELILVQLQAIFGAIPGLTAAQVHRDRGEFDEEKTVLLPIMILLDGTERKISEARNGRGVQFLPAIMELVPEIYLIMKPKVLNKASEYGPEISGWRMKVIKAIVLDAGLLAILGANGSIDYRGMDTDMQAGRSMEGQLQFNFAFRYVLNPSDL
jgi:hypothetical protein